MVAQVEKRFGQAPASQHETSAQAKPSTRRARTQAKTGTSMVDPIRSEAPGGQQAIAWVQRNKLLCPRPHLIP